MILWSRRSTLRVPLLLALALSPVSVVAAGQAPGEALEKVAAKGDLAGVNSLLSQGVDVNAPDKNGNTALMEAARTGRTEVVAALIAAKADLNAQNKDGWTAPMRAIFAAQAGTLQALVEARAKLDLTNNKGESALDIALQYTGNVRPELLPILGKAGVDVKGATVKGEPALIHAISSQQAGLVTGLLKAGANPNVKDSNGRPAVVLAAEKGYLESGARIIAALVAARVDVNARDARNRSALEHAVDVSKAQYGKAGERKNAGMVVYSVTSRGADEASIAAARDIVIKNRYILFDTMIFEGRKKALSLSREKAAPAPVAPASSGARVSPSRSSGPPPKGCPARTTVTKLTSSSEAFKASLPIGLATITHGKALIDAGGKSVRVFLTNGTFTAAAMNSDMVVPVKKPGEAIVKLRLMNGSTPVVPGSYTPAAGWGKPLSVSAEVVVTGGKPSGAVVTMVAAQSADTGKATITAFDTDAGYICGTFELKGALGETAGEFVAVIEK
jgi:uncharacterized protein